MNKEILNAINTYFEDCNKGINNFISSEMLSELIVNKNEDLFILDIRKKEDYAKSHIQNAYNIFWYDLGESIDVLPKENKIIVVCYTGQSAGQVVSLLKLLGYDAVSLQGGMNNGWVKSGLEVAASCAT